MQRTEEASTSVAERLVIPKSLVVIGAGTGGPTALANIIPKLPSVFPATILIVQQMRPGFTRLLAEHLNESDGAAVEEAVNHGALLASHVLMIPGCHTVTVTHNSSPDRPYLLNLEDQRDSLQKMRSRIDTAMKSAADIFTSRTIGVLLTGAGTDGLDGMKAIRDRGGTTIAQDQDSCVLYDMPKSAIDAGVVDDALPVWSIADRLIELIGDN